MIYYRKSVCEYHWEMHCREDAAFNLKAVFKIGPPPPRPRRLAGNARAYLERRRAPD